MSQSLQQTTFRLLLSFSNIIYQERTGTVHFLTSLGITLPMICKACRKNSLLGVDLWKIFTLPFHSSRSILCVFCANTQNTEVGLNGRSKGGIECNFYLQQIHVICESIPYTFTAYSLFKHQNKTFYIYRKHQKLATQVHPASAIKSAHGQFLFLV